MELRRQHKRRRARTRSSREQARMDVVQRQEIPCKETEVEKLWEGTDRWKSWVLVNPPTEHMSKEEEEKKGG
jgi:hypothetical protein